jgi:hypothetical protein
MEGSETNLAIENRKIKRDFGMFVWVCLFFCFLFSLYLFYLFYLFLCFPSLNTHTEMLQQQIEEIKEDLERERKRGAKNLESQQANLTEQIDNLKQEKKKVNKYTHIHTVKQT